ncbi:MAG: class I SAM-dependent methyltransferase [Candidatus Poribacteria bacterium]|nr:class I SAM-dependent methyltransferase [Candidatus Poribacteria bacterium]
MEQERARWKEVTDMMGDRRITLGRYVGYWFQHTPRRALFALSYYKFAAKMIGSDKRVIDVGCNEGLGTWLLAVECGFARGLDLDEDAIAVAKANWDDPRIEFICGDFLKQPPGQWDAVVSFDVIEHISPENAHKFLAQIADNLVHDGIAVIGTPNVTSQQYASEITKAGHVNIYSAERLEAEMGQYFTHVFLFGANDEVVHTGFMPMAHALIAVGCKKKLALQS